MKIWICEGCEAEIKKTEPRVCPICGRTKFSEELTKEEKHNPEDKKHSEEYEKIIKQLQKYDEECEPEKMNYEFED